MREVNRVQLGPERNPASRDPVPLWRFSLLHQESLVFCPALQHILERVHTSGDLTLEIFDPEVLNLESVSTAFFANLPGDERSNNHLRNVKG
jgi:hypothetical protein